jgi:hypothetical protein
VDYFHTSILNVAPQGFPHVNITQDVSRDPHGQNFWDPISPYPTANFSNHPLFAPAGPTKDDIVQGQLGDCGFASALAAIARQNPARIRHSVVELGDGTYAIDYTWQPPGAANDRAFVRVDGDLPVDGNGDLQYLHLGKGGSVWAAVLEKAWAFLRTDEGTYLSIEGTWPSEPMQAMHGSMTLDDVSVKKWSNGSKLLKAILGELQAGRSVCYTTPENNYLGPVIGRHAYTVDHVNCDANGNPTGLVLRNPWGKDGAGSDGNDDGYVTLTPAQAWGQAGYVSAAAV